MYENPKMWNLNTWNCEKLDHLNMYMRKILLWETIHIGTDINLRKIHGWVARSEMQNWGKKLDQAENSTIFKMHCWPSFHIHVYDFFDVNCHSKMALQIHVAPRISKTVLYFISSNLVGYDHILDICRKTNS